MACIKFFILCILSFIYLNACSFSPQKNYLGEVIENHYTVDGNATIVSANYGQLYLLEGNFLARYSNFDLARIRSRIVKEGHLEINAGHYNTFEVRDRNGKTHTTLNITPDNLDDALRFSVNNQIYFIRAGNPVGSIVVNIPSYHVAFNSLSR